MRGLLALAFGVTAVMAAASVSATVYVPGQYKDGVYIRPHFLDYPGQTLGRPLLLPQDDEAEGQGAGARSDHAGAGRRYRELRRALPTS